MMTQSVMTQAANFFTNAAANTASKSKQSGNDFSQLMNSSLKTTGNNFFQENLQGNGVYVNRSGTVPGADKKTKETASNVQDSPRSNDGSNNYYSSSTVQSKQSSAAATKADAQKAVAQPEEIKITDDAKDDNGKEEASLSDQILNQIAAMLASIQEAAMKALNMSQEEFNQFLADQGMSAVDLLQPENLQQLVLSANGQTDIMAALTDESLAATINQLIENVNVIKEGNNLGLTNDQIKAILAQLKSSDAKADTIANAGPTTDQTAVPEQLQNAQVKQTDQTITDLAQKKDDSASADGSNKDILSDTSKLSAAVEKQTDTQENAGNDKKQDMNAPDQFQTFIDNMVNSSQKVQTDFNRNMAQVAELRDIANQIIDKIKVSVTQDKTSMELSLNPDHLGKVNLSVQSKDGIMTAHFIVQNEISKEAIESQIHTLRDTLNNQGIKVEAIEVTVSANAFEQNGNQNSENQSEAQKNHSGRKISFDEAVNMTEETEAENEAQDLLGALGSVVDYTA